MTYIIIEYRLPAGQKQIDLTPLEDDENALEQATKLRKDYEEVKCSVERVFVAELV